MRHLVFPLRLAAAAVATVAAAGPVRAQVALRPGNDAPPAVVAARRAQQAFERARRGELRVFSGVPDSRCEVRMGRLCYWNNNAEPKLPAERPAVGRRRDELLDALARAAAAAPKDDWVAGQRVAYLIEARRQADAERAAAACAGTRWWCDALRGLALHERNDHVGATAAFDSALAAMPEELRCRWTDLRFWLDDRLHGAYRRTECGPARDAWERRFWWLAKPLLMLPGNDLRNELLARRVMGVVHAEAASPHGIPWGDDMEESELRYGWPTTWVARAPTGLLSASAVPEVVGYEPTPSFDFLPSASAVDDPAAADAEAWNLRDAQAHMRYAPRYAPHGFVALPHQLARFRRGDSTIVVGAWDVGRAARWDSAVVSQLPDSARRLDVGLVLVDSAGESTRAVRPGSPRRGALAITVGALPRVASLEVLDTLAGRAARARYALAPLARDAAVSDVLLLDRGAGPAADLDSVLAHANGSSVVRAGGVVGLYWESYVQATPEEPLTVSVRATRLDSRWIDRAKSAIGLGEKDTPVAVRFVDLGRPDGKPGRSLTVNWPSVPPGDYRLELTVGSHAPVSQVVRVER